MRYTPMRVGYVLLSMTVCLVDAGTAAARSQPGPTATAATQDAPTVRTSLLRLDTILTTLVVESPTVAGARDRALEVLRALLQLSTAWPADSPAPYRRSVATLANTVERTASDDRQSLPAVLDALTDDLGAKLEHCRASGGKLGGLVNVSVRTLAAGREAPHWQVFYMPKILEVSPGATPDVFPTLSSPTVERLVPGRYLMWAREPDSGQQGERLILKVGEGRASLDIELPVPSKP